MILSNFTQFIETIFNELEKLRINTKELKIDHLGFQASSAEDYVRKNEEIFKFATRVSENIVGGRRVGIFKLNNSLEYGEDKINVIEVIEPKEGGTPPSAFEHIEFLTSKSLEIFLKDYSNINWDLSALNREEFPMLILKLSNGLRAKFPRLGVLEELKRQAKKI